MNRPVRNFFFVSKEDVFSDDLSHKESLRLLTDSVFRKQGWPQWQLLNQPLLDILDSFPGLCVCQEHLTANSSIGNFGARYLFASAVLYIPVFDNF